MLKQGFIMTWLAASLCAAGPALAQDSGSSNRIDTIRSDAPTLAAYGKHTIGVKTYSLKNPGQLDILKAKAGAPIPAYDRSLVVEVWYPAKAGSPRADDGEYKRVFARDGKTAVTLRGKAIRDAQPDISTGPYPLLIVSHGYPGNRFLLSHLAENLASKGYVVASIDHTDSTYIDAVWDNVRMNNIAQHFSTAFLGKHLKNDAGMDDYLDLVERAKDGKWSTEENGNFKADHSYWRGFPARTAAGLTLEHRKP